jgi:hypothetical protein
MAKSDDEKMAQKARVVIDKFVEGYITQEEAQLEVARAFGAYGNIEHKMVHPSQEKQFQKVRIKGGAGSAIGKMRGELYTNALGRMKDAIKGGYYFECIALCDSVIVDRIDAWTQSILHTSERQFPAGTAGSATVFLGKTMSRLKLKKSDADLKIIHRIEEWAKKRNEVLHNFVIVNEANVNRDVGAREQYALEASEEGFALVRDVLNHTDKVIRDIKKGD